MFTCLTINKKGCDTKGRRPRTRPANLKKLVGVDICNIPLDESCNFNVKLINYKICIKKLLCNDHGYTPIPRLMLQRNENFKIIWKIPVSFFPSLIHRPLQRHCCCCYCCLPALLCSNKKCEKCKTQVHGKSFLAFHTEPSRSSVLAGPCSHGQPEVVTEAPERDERKTRAAEMGRHPQVASAERPGLFRRASLESSVHHLSLWSSNIKPAIQGREKKKNSHRRRQSVQQRVFFKEIDILLVSMLRGTLTPGGDTLH